MDELKSLVFEVSRGTTHDGPGMRTSVFLKGCPLSCLWCQNPEGIDPGQEVWWDKRKCIRCFECRDACPVTAITVHDEGLRIDRRTCTVCGRCVAACPSRAMAFAARELTLDQVVSEVLKDRDYYERFGGGVTVSGGEPLHQHVFVARLLSELKGLGIHTALDTSGFSTIEALDSVLPFADCILYDLKLLDPALHQKHTGRPNEVILRNLARLAGYIRKTAGSRAMALWIRTPLIPDATATERNIQDIGRFLRDTAPDIAERWELCAFNSACVSKYRKMGKGWAYESHPFMGQESVQRLRAAALATGFPEDRLVVSGLIAGAVGDGCANDP